MSTTRDPNVPATPSTDDTDQLRRQIEHTREDLGDTVAALADKADVKAQASVKADEIKEQASAKADEIKEKVHEVEETAKAKAYEAGDKAKENPVPLVIAGLVVLLVLNRFRKRRKLRRREASIVEQSLYKAMSGGTPVAAVLVPGGEVAAS